MVKHVTFAEAIRSARTRDQMSQKALADKSGLNQTRISLLERGLRPQQSDIEAICGVLELHTTEVA